jgi:5,10-methenyltetrahydrofolate synthetase
VCENLLEQTPIERMTTCVAYEVRGSEVDPAVAVERLLRRGLCVYLPDWEGDRCRFVAPSTGLPLEGQGGSVAILVPGVAFDTQGVRLGRGAGWYDRILSRYPEALKIGLAFEEQIASTLPSEPWDVRMDLVVTNQRVLHRTPARPGAPRGISI